MILDNISIDRNQTVRDVKLTILKELQLISTKLNDVTLVIGPSPNHFGACLNDDSIFDESLVKFDKVSYNIYSISLFKIKKKAVNHLYLKIKGYP